MNHHSNKSTPSTEFSTETTDTSSNHLLTAEQKQTARALIQRWHSETHSQTPILNPVTEAQKAQAQELISCWHREMRQSDPPEECENEEKDKRKTRQSYLHPHSSPRGGQDRERQSDVYQVNC